jgi:hypothetical protein
MVAVVEVGGVRMRVLDRLVPVRVRVRLARGVLGSVRVPMMLVVHVKMIVREGLVRVEMGMLVTQQESEADQHQEQGAELPEPEALLEAKRLPRG